MTAVTVKGLETLRRRLEARDLAPAAAEALRRQADAIAEEAARAAPGELARTVEVVDKTKDETIAFAIGTAHRAGRFIEHGTLRRPASPWLWPAFRARLPRIKQSLRDTVIGSFARRGSEV